MRPTEAIIDLGRISHNVRALGRLTRPHVHHMAVVKADAYGHGAVPVARAALEAGADWLGVALVEEGRELRDAGIGAPVLLLGAIAPESAAAAVRDDLAVTVCSRDLAQTLSDEATALGGEAEVHLKVDTGMGRIGVLPQDVSAFAAWLVRLPHLRLGGVFTHLASADEADLSFAHRQIREFQSVLQSLESSGIRIPLRHAANTAGTMTLPSSHFDLVRTGIGIYGLYPSAEVARRPRLEPAMSFATRVAHLKEVPEGTPLSYGSTHVTRARSRIATLPVGYADGYPRLLSNRGVVAVRGVRAPIVGRVCMDMTLIDVTGVPGAREGDEVVLFGKQGEGEISADEIAEQTGTINYEITCSVGKRVPRRYV